tara:strand:+ start:25 stop:3405 length:3381 start_codon:yes stop_codon:yes gene_type:complete
MPTKLTNKTNLMIKETEKQTEEAFNLGSSFKEAFEYVEPPAFKFYKELKKDIKNLTGTNTKNKGMSYAELIADSIPFSNVGDFDEEYKTSMETLYEAFNNNPKDFLKQLITGIGDNLGINRPYGVPSPLSTTTPLKEDALLKNPYEYGKGIVTDIATNVYDLFTKTEDMRAQQIYNKSFNDLTGEEQNKIRESILGNIITAAEVATVGGFTATAARRALRENIANQNIDHSPNAYVSSPVSSPQTTKTISTFKGDEIVTTEVDADYISPWKIETEESIFTFNSNPINKKVEKNIDFNKGVFTFSPTIEALNNFPNYNTLKNKQLIAPSSLWTHLTNSKINNKMVLKSAGGEKVFSQKALDFYIEENIINPELVKNIDFDSDSPKEIAKIYEIIESSLYKFNQATKKAKGFNKLGNVLLDDMKYEVDLGHTKKYFSSAEDLESYIQMTNNDFLNTINKALVSTALGGRSIVLTVDSYKNFDPLDPVMGGPGHDPALPLEQFQRYDSGDSQVLRLSDSPVFNTNVVPFSETQTQVGIGLKMSGDNQNNFNVDYKNNFYDLQGILVLRNAANIKAKQIQAVNSVLPYTKNIKKATQKYLKNIRIKGGKTAVVTKFDEAISDSILKIENRLKTIVNKNPALIQNRFKDPSIYGGESFQQYDQSILTLLTDTEIENVSLGPVKSYEVVKKLFDLGLVGKSFQSAFKTKYQATDLIRDLPSIFPSNDIDKVWKDIQRIQRNYGINFENIRSKAEEDLILKYMEEVNSQVNRNTDLSPVAGAQRSSLNYVHGFGSESLGHIRFALTPDKDLLVINEIQFDVLQSLYKTARKAGESIDIPKTIVNFKDLPNDVENYFKQKLFSYAYPDTFGKGDLGYKIGAKNFDSLRISMGDAKPDFNIFEKNGKFYIQPEKGRYSPDDGKNTNSFLETIFDDIDDINKAYPDDKKYKIELKRVEEQADPVDAPEVGPDDYIYEIQFIKDPQTKSMREREGRRFLEAEKQSGRLPVADIPDAMEKLLSSLVVEAQRRGATKIVLPPINKILEARDEGGGKIPLSIKPIYTKYFDQAVQNLIKKADGKIKPIFIDLQYNTGTYGAFNLETVKGKGLDISDIVKDVEKIKGTKTLTVGLAKGGLV